MDECRPIHIFRRDASSIRELRKHQPDLLSIWCDPYSAVARALPHVIKPSVLFIEEGLVGSLQRLEWSSNVRSVPIPVSSGAEADIVETVAPAICILPSNDTHVHMFSALLDDKYRFQHRFSLLKREGSETALQELGLDQIEITESDLRNSSALMVGNDWGAVEKYWIGYSHRIGIPSICVQESVIHFGDRIKRMQWCDYPFLQGPRSVGPLNRRLVFLTGNPRYESLTPQPLMREKAALINCNFTYGIYEDVREIWIEDVVRACEISGYDYLIAQHPRDNGTLTRYNARRSNASCIHELIRYHSVVITRFSSLIHESLALGRPVIYYNPHGEDMNYDFDADDKHLWIIYEKGSLRRALEYIASNPIAFPDKDRFFDEYRSLHFGGSDGGASRRVAEAATIASRLGREFPSEQVIRHIPSWIALQKARLSPHLQIDELLFKD